MDNLKYFYSILILFSLVIIGIYGADYYFAPLTERFFIPHHNLLKPTGFVGHGLGIAGSLLIIIGVSSYMVRKRVRAFNKSGGMKYWLEFHIFLCTLGPILVLYHTTFKFGGIVSVSFWSMVAVVLSGVIGRFIYVQIPRSIKGRELTMEEREQTLEIFYEKTLSFADTKFAEKDFFAEIKKQKNFFSSLVYITKENFRAKKKIRIEKKRLRKVGINRNDMKNYVKNLRSFLIMKRKIVALQTMQKLFQYWHIAHLPFAIVMLLIMIVHIIVAISFGYTWI